MKWRYFKYVDVGPADLYRWPDNGKSLTQQHEDAVEIYKPDGTWQSGQYWSLVKEATDGWFSEKQDEISEADAVIQMAKISGRTIPCWMVFERWKELAY